MKNFKYFGKKEEIGPCEIYVKVEYWNGATCNEELKHIVRHSPDGFQMGYGGSGPADTALSILTDYCNRTKRDLDLADKYYQDFKFKFIAPVKGDLEILGEDVEKFLNERIKKEKK